MSAEGRSSATWAEKNGLCILSVSVLGDPVCSGFGFLCQRTSEPFLVAESLGVIKITTAVPVLGSHAPQIPKKSQEPSAYFNLDEIAVLRLHLEGAEFRV